MSHRLIVLPDDTADAIIDPIKSAQHTLNIRMFLFTDPALLKAVIAARHRGVHVRVMLNPARRDGTSDNLAARDALLAAGVSVHDSSTEFAVTHQKSMGVDNRIGFIESLNWETFEPRAGSGLIWCPNNGRERIADFIDGAHETLWLQNERYQDMVIIERLVRAAKRGVRVRIMSRALHKLKKKKLFEGVSGLRIVHDVGANVRALKHLKLHGKIMIADDERAIVGSINLSPGSFDDRRELAVETSSKHVVRRLVETAQHDWKHSCKLPLSDEAVLADLEGHGIKEVSRLALVHEDGHGQHP